MVIERPGFFPGFFNTLLQEKGFVNIFRSSESSSLFLFLAAKSEWRVQRPQTLLVCFRH